MTSRFLPFLLVLLPALAACTAESAHTPAPERPNVVFVVSDDQAWTDYGFAGHPHIKTPNLDQLAASGLHFARGYVPSSLCRPSLMTLVTGLYPHQHGITGNDPPRGTDRREMLRHVARAQTLPRLLATAGYRSFQCGKWWEGSHTDGGFTDGMTHGDPTRGGRHGDAGLAIGRKGLRPVENFLDQTGTQPFFLWFAPMLPHTPHEPPQRLLERYLPLTDSVHVARYWAMCEWWDECVGELMAMLEERGLAHNTLVVYLSDNGWLQNEKSAGFAPRSKRSPYEAGIRTPILLRWPAALAPAVDTRTPVSSIDIVPTVLAACRVPAPGDLPGISLLPESAPALAGRHAVFGEIFEHDVVDLDAPAASLRFRWSITIAQDGSGRLHKLIQPNGGQRPQLFDVGGDPHELLDLATEQPDLVQSLRRQLDSWWLPDRQ